MLTSTFGSFRFSDPVVTQLTLELKQGIKVSGWLPAKRFYRITSSEVHPFSAVPLNLDAPLRANLSAHPSQLVPWHPRLGWKICSVFGMNPKGWIGEHKFGSLEDYCSWFAASLYFFIDNLLEISWLGSWFVAWQCRNRIPYMDKRYQAADGCWKTCHEMEPLPRCGETRQLQPDSADQGIDTWFGDYWHGSREPTRTYNKWSVEFTLLRFTASPMRVTSWNW